VDLAEISDANRAFPYKDSRGGYELWELRNRNPRFNRSNRPNLFFPLYADPVAFEKDHHHLTIVRTSDSQLEIFPIDSDGTDGCWRWSQELIKKKSLDSRAPDLVGRMVRGGKWTVYQRARKNTKSAKSIFKGSEYLNEAGTTLLTSMGLRGRFDHPKPLGLIRTIAELTTEDGDLIMDSFAGSGTTGHSVLDLNKQENGNRRFILVEMEPGIAADVTAERLRRVITGYDKGGDPAKPVPGLGGGFRYCRLGTPLFNEFGDIDGAVAFPDLAAHVFFAETGAPIPAKARAGHAYLGKHGGKAVYLLFAPGQEGTPREAFGNVLTPGALAALPPAPAGFGGTRVVYAEGCTVAPDRLKAEGVVFKQIPYHIAGV
jgi:hypothetical protein